MINLMKARRQEEPLTVSALTAQIKRRLEEGFGQVQVVGEVSGWSPAASGHVYFSLKDRDALLSSVLWKSTAERMRIRIRDGDKVICTGRISVFEKRGSYQLSVDTIVLEGEGDLWQRFERLKAKLAAEGLFDESRKRPLPRFPKAIGVVSSPTGAVIRDILSILGRRAPGLPVILFPAAVQGTGAAQEIARGVRRLAASGKVDLIVVARGGGSMEDLWEFNSEELARTIAASPIPVVSAVGHQTDFTIADFVADVRAATPSAAAELISAADFALREHLANLLDRNKRALRAKAQQRRYSLERLLHGRAIHRPIELLRQFQQRTDLALRRLPEVTRRKLERRRSVVERLNAALEGHNPQLILNKGYAIVRQKGAVVPRAAKLKATGRIVLRFADGTAEVLPADPAPDLFEA
jgi:exodeoxyribonuclease VII large subunit